jgi:hypothetical protein
VTAPKPRGERELCGEVWQNGALQACVESTDREAVFRETEHYAMVYRIDGPVIVKYKLLKARLARSPAGTRACSPKGANTRKSKGKL